MIEKKVIKGPVRRGAKGFSPPVFLRKKGDEMFVEKIVSPFGFKILTGSMIQKFFFFFLGLHVCFFLSIISLIITVI